MIEPLEWRVLLSRATGIDVSQYQGVMNWNTAASQGIKFAVVRALPDLWVANWNQTSYGDPVTGTGSPHTSPWSTWKFWQYDSPNGLGAQYGAESADIDLDVFNGDVTALQSMLVVAPEVTVL